MAKRITALFLVFCLVFCFASCTEEANSSSSKLSSAATSSKGSASTSSKDATASTTTSEDASSDALSSAASSKPASSKEEVSSEEEIVINYDSPSLRVMSYNILHPEWCSTESYVSVSDRIGLLQAIVNDFKPDVIGLQETSDGWHSSIRSKIVKNSTYEFACRKSNSGEYNMTTFIYNTETVKLLEEKIIDLDSTNYIRVFAVALFERISDGKKFVVTNTHPSPPKTQLDRYNEHFRILPDIIKKQMEKHKGLPFIMTGDFNTYEQDENYTKLMNAVGVKDAKYAAKTLVKDYCTFSGYKVAPKPGNEKCIDHIFVNNRVGVKQFDIIIDHSVENISDHIPIYADIVI